jgi:hypothetical protein
MFSFVVGIGQPSWGWRRGWARVTRYQKWLKPEIPATQEADIERITDQGKSRQKVNNIPFLQVSWNGGAQL